MKKVNAIIIVTILATFVISMFAFQPTTTETSNKVLPSATPSPRKIRKTKNVITFPESHADDLRRRTKKHKQVSGDGTTNHFRSKAKRIHKPNTGDGTTNHFRTNKKRSHKPTR